MKSGLLLVDKPGGMTSHDVVAQCRRWLNRKDIGHAGTLDPMATGLLVILVGKATKLSDFILNGDKAYETQVLLGVETDTDDLTGAVISETSTEGINHEQIAETVKALSGTLELPVPIYSAVKVKGQKLYQKARQGEGFKPPIRPMRFDNVTLLDTEGPRVVVGFSCSKGSYVRAWGKELGKKLGCGGTLQTLRRVRSEPYEVGNAQPLSVLLETAPENLENCAAWIPLKRTLPDWPTVKVAGPDEKLLSNGQIPRKLERFLELEYGGMQERPGIKVLSRRSGELIALLSHEPPLKFKIRRVFPAQ